MKIFKKIKFDKTSTSSPLLEVIDPKNADFRVIFIVRRHLVALEADRGQIYFQRKYAEWYTKRKLLTWKNRKDGDRNHKVAKILLDNVVILFL